MPIRAPFLELPAAFDRGDRAFEQRAGRNRRAAVDRHVARDSCGDAILNLRGF